MTTAITPEPAKKPSPKRTKSKTSPAKKKVSKVKRNGAVAKAWEIFGKHPKAQRKDALAAAVRAGVNANTAKTQYQRWLHRGDKN